MPKFNTNYVFSIQIFSPRGWACCGETGDLIEARQMCLQLIKEKYKVRVARLIRDTGFWYVLNEGDEQSINETRVVA